MNKTNIKIRNITEKDSSLVRLLASSCPPLDVHTPYTYWVICKYFNNSCFILEDEEKAIGYITSLETDECVFVWQIAILENYRSQNLSKLLIDAVVSYAKLKNKKLQVTISSENKRSYASFKSYCDKNSYTITATGEVALTDFIDISFKETETVYEIELKNNRKIINTIEI